MRTLLFRRCLTSGHVLSSSTLHWVFIPHSHTLTVMCIYTQMDTFVFCAFCLPVTDFRFRTMIQLEQCPQITQQCCKTLGLMGLLLMGCTLKNTFSYFKRFCRIEKWITFVSRRIRCRLNFSLLYYLIWLTEFSAHYSHPTAKNSSQFI